MDKKWGNIAAVVSAAAAVIALGPALFSTCTGGTPSAKPTVEGARNTVGNGNIVVNGDIRGDGAAVGRGNSVKVDKRQAGTTEGPKDAASAESP